jgi:predicted CXXCH cytochrome family protein
MRKIGILAVLTLGCMLAFSTVASATVMTKGVPGTAVAPASAGGVATYNSPAVPKIENNTVNGDNNVPIHSAYSKTTDACQSCHAIHTSNDTSGTLLQWTDPQTACFACHDGTVGTTYNVVLGTHSGGTVNSAGLFGTVAMKTADPSLSSHAMSSGATEVSTSSAPGGSENDVTKDANGDWTTAFECVACHDPHGTMGNARILNPNVNGYATQARATMAAADAKGETLTSTDQLTYQAKKGYWMTGHGYDPAVYIDDVTATAGFKVDPLNGRIIFATALGSSQVVKVLYSPGLIVNMTIANKLTTTETVKYQNGINTFCGACHTDYNNQGKTSGVNGVGGAYKQLLGTYQAAYRHSVGFTRTATTTDPGFADGTDANSLDSAYPGLKFDTSNPKAPATRVPTADCLTCHYAHGTSDSFIASSLTAQGTIGLFGGTNVAGDPILKTYDTARSSALKRLPNMGVCQACHNKTGTAPVAPL